MEAYSRLSASLMWWCLSCFFFQAEDGIRADLVTGVQTCALPISPATTQGFALIMDDPDAPVGTWVHWVLYDLPANTRELTEGVAKQEQLASGARQGRNDFGKIGYGGPCPPPGKPHRYFFKLYALDAKLNLKAGASKADVEGAMKGRVLAQSELMGKYGR